jgi:hypothetical protein
MAQRLSGETVEPADRILRRAFSTESPLPSLGDLGDDWSGLSEEQAALAYTLSLAAVELLYEKLHPAGVRNLLGNPSRLPELGAALQSELKIRLAR